MGKAPLAPVQVRVSGDGAGKDPGWRSRRCREPRGSRAVLCNPADIGCWDVKVGEERRGMALHFPQMCGGPI